MTDSADLVGRFRKSYDIFEGTDRLRSRRSYAVVGVSVVLDAGFDLLPTFNAPLQRRPAFVH